VYVIPDGASSETQLANAYPFRFDRDSIDDRMMHAEVGQFKICNFRIDP
jgi:hypothetical protein